MSQHGLTKTAIRGLDSILLGGIPSSKPGSHETPDPWHRKGLRNGTGPAMSLVAPGRVGASEDLRPPAPMPTPNHTGVAAEIENADFRRSCAVIC